MSPACQQREWWFLKGVLDRDRHRNPPPLLPVEKDEAETPLPPIDQDFESSRLFAENHRLRHAR